MDYVLVAIGGGVGAMARMAVGRRVSAVMGNAFPWGTMFVNVSGALVIGFLMTILMQRTVGDSWQRMLLVVGFLGGYTTFSSYTWEAMRLFEQGRPGAALGYIAGSNLVGLAGCALGIWLAKSVVTG
jgi:CrcB protein